MTIESSQGGGRSNARGCGADIGCNQHVFFMSSFRLLEEMKMEKKRGRNSGASLETVLSVTGKPARPAAPDCLTTDQAAVWQNVVKSMPADWFGAETHPLLQQFCRHVVTAREVDRLISEHAAGELDLNLYNRLLIMRARESAALTALARTMRMTQQARIDPKTAGRRISGMPRANLPWMPPEANK
jgi:hypothetical protein